MEDAVAANDGIDTAIKNLNKVAEFPPKAYAISKNKSAPALNNVINIAFIAFLSCRNCLECVLDHISQA